MRKLLLLPITLPPGMARGALEGAVKTAADALMDLAREHDHEDAGTADGPRRCAPAAGRRSPPPPAPGRGCAAAARCRSASAAAAASAARRPPSAAVVDLDEARPAPATASDVAEDLGLEAGHVDEEPDELVESEGAADPGAELHVDEPWPGYGSARRRPTSSTASGRRTRRRRRSSGSTSSSTASGAPCSPRPSRNPAPEP